MLHSRNPHVIIEVLLHCVVADHVNALLKQENNNVGVIIIHQLKCKHGGGLSPGLHIKCIKPSLHQGCIEREKVSVKYITMLSGNLDSMVMYLSLPHP